jgi:hypothetical protein
VSAVHTISSRRLRVSVPPWLRQYRRERLRPDVIAGLTLASYAVPVSMAYASLAGPPQPPQPIARAVEVRRTPLPHRPIFADPDPLRESKPQATSAALPAIAAYARRVSRKQLNLNPETLRMVDELLHYIQTQSVQKDAKASEMFHALVAALYDSREFLSLTDVPPRGRWGIPTAFAFPVALKNAFHSAIAQWTARHGR